jgi:hypothetical protein
MNPAYSKNNLADSTMEITFDSNTTVEVDPSQKKIPLEEYPTNNPLPPFWKPLSAVCKLTGFEKHLGMLDRFI